MPWLSLIFDYCIVTVWGHCNATLSNKLQKLQNRAACILTFSSDDANAADALFERPGWNWSDVQRKIQEATIVLSL